MKYNYFQDEKLKYEDIEVPDELLLLVRRTVAADRKKKSSAKYYRMAKMAGAVAAVLFLCLTIGVNSSYAFAETAVKIPLVKSVAKAVVVRSYRQEIIAVYEENKKPAAPEAAPMEEQEPEMPEQTVAAVSGDEVVFEGEEKEQPKEQETEPEAVPVGIDAWKAEMTLEKLKEVTEAYTPDMEKRYAKTPEKLRTILLAEMPERDAALYGYHEGGKIAGVALRVKDTYEFYDWAYMNGSKKLPEISWADADGDGEEEIVVFLYNGEPPMKEISKEDIAAPGEDAADGVNGAPDSTEQAGAAANGAVNSDPAGAGMGETTGSAGAGAETGGTANSVGTGAEQNKIVNSDRAGAETSKTGNAVQINAETKKTENSGEHSPTDPAFNENAVISGVSGNDTEESDSKPMQIAGEIWIIDLEGDNWSATVLSVDDYESQILHQLKAAYDEVTAEIQLYLMEEPFGEPVKLPAENLNGFTYEEVNFAPARTFATEEGLTLQFRMEAEFLDENMERVICPLDIDLKAEIYLEEDTLTVKNIKIQ